MISTTFGEYLRKTRLNNGLTLTQMGAKLEIDSGALSKIENGKKLFDEKKLTTLAKEFQIDINHLKNEYFSEKIAVDLIIHDCSEEVLSMVKSKIKIFRQRKIKQMDLGF